MDTNRIKKVFIVKSQKKKKSIKEKKILLDIYAIPREYYRHTSLPRVRHISLQDLEARCDSDG